MLRCQEVTKYCYCPAVSCYFRMTVIFKEKVSWGARHIPPRDFVDYRLLNVDETQWQFHFNWKNAFNLLNCQSCRRHNFCFLSIYPTMWTILPKSVFGLNLMLIILSQIDGILSQSMPSPQKIKTFKVITKTLDPRVRFTTQNNSCKIQFIILKYLHVVLIWRLSIFWRSFCGLFEIWC